MSRNAQLLLLDVLKLRVQYDEHEFGFVLEVLKSKEKHELLVSVLELSKGLIEISTQKASNAKKAKPSLLTQDALRKMELDSPEKCKIIEQIQSLAESKRVFPNKKELVQFIIRRVSKAREGDTRQILVDQYIASLCELSVAELEHELSLIKKPQKAEIDSFLRMADRIVESKRQ